MGLRRGERVLALIVIASWIVSGFLFGPGSVSGLTPRGPIYIASDAEFTPQNGVTGGNGTPSDPYRIEGWDISSGSVGIYIQNTNAWFVIRSVRVSALITGIHLFSVANGAIEDATVSGNEYAIRVQTSRNVDVLGSNITASSSGIDTSSSEEVTVAGNTFSGLTSYGLAITYARNLTVVGNTFVLTGIGLYGPDLSHVNTHTITPDNLANGKPIRYYRDCNELNIDGVTVGQLLVANCTNVRVANLGITNTSEGIVLAFVRGAVMTGNNVSGNVRGLRLHSTSNATVANNTLFGNREAGASLEGPAFTHFANNSVVGSKVGVAVTYSVSNTTIVGNEIANNRYSGVLVYSAQDVLITRNNLTGNGAGAEVWMGSRAIRIHHNNFVANARPGYDEPGSQVTWSDGYPSGGNFWSDYRGVDLCSGPGQDVCPPPDGIGDTPHPVDSDAVDRFPLMNPVSPPTPPPPDSEVPHTTAVLAGTEGLSGWYRSPVTVALSATDSGSGVASTTYRVDGGPWETYVSPFTIGSDGAHAVEYYSSDNAGNTEPPQTIEVRIDVTAPSAAASLDGTPGTSSWYVSEVSVSLTATDAASQVALIQYRLDGGATLEYTAPVHVVDGEHHLDFWATDVAGNPGPVERLDIRIDTVAPATEATIIGTPGNGGWYRSSVSIVLAGVDATSGVASIFYRVNGGTVETYVYAFTLGIGEFELEFWATDVGGNAELPRTRAVRVDPTPPEFGPTGPSDVVTRRDVTIVWSATDAVSGIDHYEVSVDGAGYDDVGLSESLALDLADGIHRVRVRAVDRAGNEQDREIVFRVDANPLSPTGPYAGIPSYVLLGAGAGAATAYLWRRRRGRGKD